MAGLRIIIGRLPKSKRALDLVVHPACRCPTLRISPKKVGISSDALS
jgi:hypothetical protein